MKCFKYAAISLFLLPNTVYSETFVCEVVKQCDSENGCKVKETAPKFPFFGFSIEIRSNIFTFRYGTKISGEMQYVRPVELNLTSEADVGFYTGRPNERIYTLSKTSEYPPVSNLSVIFNTIGNAVITQTDITTYPEVRTYIAKCSQ